MSEIPILKTKRATRKDSKTKHNTNTTNYKAVQSKLKQILHPNSSKPITFETYSKSKKKSLDQKKVNKTKSMSDLIKLKQKEKELLTENSTDIDCLNFSKLNTNIYKKDSYDEDDLFGSFAKNNLNNLVSYRYENPENNSITSLSLILPSDKENLNTNNNNKTIPATPSTICNYYEKCDFGSTNKKSNGNFQNNVLKKNLNDLFDKEFINNNTNNDKLLDNNIFDAIKVNRNTKNFNNKFRPPKTKSSTNKLIFNKKTSSEKQKYKSGSKGKENKTSFNSKTNNTNNNYININVNNDNIFKPEYKPDNKEYSSISGHKRNSYMITNNQKNADKFINKKNHTISLITNEKAKQSQAPTNTANNINFENLKQNIYKTNIYYKNKGLTTIKKSKYRNRSQQKPIMLCFDQMKYDAYFVTPTNKKLKTNNQSNRITSNANNINYNNYIHNNYKKERTNSFNPTNNKQTNQNLIKVNTKSHMKSTSLASTANTKHITSSNNKVNYRSPAIIKMGTANQLKISKTLTEQTIFYRIQKTPKNSRIPRASATNSMSQKKFIQNSEKMNHVKNIGSNSNYKIKAGNCIFNNYKSKTQSQMKHNQFSSGGEFSRAIKDVDYQNNKFVKQKLIDRMNNASAKNYQFLLHNRNINYNANNNALNNNKILIDNISAIIKTPAKDNSYTLYQESNEKEMLKYRERRKISDIPSLEMSNNNYFNVNVPFDND